jgi:hypothetical protein
VARDRIEESRSAVERDDSLLAGKIIDFAAAAEALGRERAEAERNLGLEAIVRQAAGRRRACVHLPSLTEDLLLLALLIASIAAFVLLASSWGG